MLMVTTTVGMLNGVHGNTSNLGPAVTLHFVFVVCPTGLQHGLVNTTTSGDNSDHGAISRGNHLNKDHFVLKDSKVIVFSSSS